MGLAGSQASPLLIDSVSRLSDLIYYRVSQPQSCIRLLNARSVVGCAASTVEAPLRVFNGLPDPAQGIPRVRKRALPLSACVLEFCGLLFKL